MRGPRLTEENLRNQVDVVKEEIRVNVLNRPYGGFPWLTLPPVLFDTFPNAHDGYGSFDDLESATVADAADFFRHYYASGNAVLAVSGDIDTAEAVTLIERHFGDVPARPAPDRPDFAEPDLTVERRTTYPDKLAPLPAVASAWRVPDPIDDFAAYLPYVVLAEVLTDGDASRLVERLVRRDRTVTSVGGYLGFMGDPFDVRDPTALLLQAHLPPGGDVDKVLRTLDEELDRLAHDGLGDGELARTQARMATHLLRDTDAVLGRRCGWRCWSSSAASRGCSANCPVCSARSPTSRSGRRGHPAPGAPRVRRGPPRRWVPVSARSEPGLRAPQLRQLPPLGPTRRLKLPRQAERTLGNGLTVIVVRRPAVPLVELRLWMPFGRAHLARGHLLTQTLLSGTETMSSVQIAAELQKIGGGLSAGLDPDR